MPGSIVLASGQGVLPFMLIGLPAAAAGIACLIAAAILAFKKRAEDSRTVKRLCLAGALLVGVLVLSPKLDPLTEWVVRRVLKP